MRYDDSSGKYNVNVISFHPWRVYCFLDSDGSNVIRNGMDRAEVPEVDRWILQSRIQLLEKTGPPCLPGFVIPVADNFYMLSLTQTGKAPMTPVCCYGPFGDSDVQEITLLTWAPIEQGRLKASDVLPVARDNFDILVKDRTRRIREPIVGTISRRL
jgi:hypothetical protein